MSKMKSPKETRVDGMETYGVSGDVDLIYIKRNSNQSLVRL